MRFRCFREVAAAGLAALCAASAYARPVPQWSDESALKILGPKSGCCFVIAYSEDGEITGFRRPSDLLDEQVWANDKWRQVVPRQVWKLKDLFGTDYGVKVEVSQDGERTLVKDDDTTIRSNQPDFVVATFIENRTGKVLRTLKLGDVIKDFVNVRPTPIDNAKYYWGFIDRLGKSGEFKVYTCEGNLFVFNDTTGALAQTIQLPQGRWKDPSQPDFEMVCGDSH